MNGYICTKACTLGGTAYNAGDDIPAEAVLPNRVRALTRQGYIAPVTTASAVITASDAPRTPQDEPREPAPLVIPIKTKDGWMELNMAPDDVCGAISVLQLNAEDAAKAIADIPNDEPLILIDALETRKTVKTAITERVEALKAPEGSDPEQPGGQPDGQQSGDQDKEPEQPPGGGSGEEEQKQGDA